jgi:hypothetical protein
MMDMLQDDHSKSAQQTSNFILQLENLLGPGEPLNLDLVWNKSDPVQSSSPLDLDKNSTTGESENTYSVSHIPTTASRLQSSNLQSKTRKYVWIWISALTFVILSAFSTFFAYQLLISESSVPRALKLSPGKTVLAINVLSQSLAFLGQILFSDVMEALRWAFLCREKGVLLATFLGLSRATSIGGVACLCSIRGSHIFWCIQRYLNPERILHLPD